MKVERFNKLRKWQQRLYSKAEVDAINYIIDKYHIGVDELDKVNIKFTNSLNSKYYKNEFVIKLSINNYSFIYLYDRKKIGNYNKYIRTTSYHSYASMLIHELTHYIQHIQNRKFSEIETTRNEIEYLENNGYKIMK